MTDNANHKTINAVGAIIKRENKILAAQRGYGNYKGWWEFPGGKIEQGEQPEAALIREIKEELNTAITIDRYFDTIEYDYGEFYLVMKCYLCSLSNDQANDQIQLVEHLSAKWLGKDDINTVKWLAADLPIIEKLLRQKII